MFRDKAVAESSCTQIFPSSFVPKDSGGEKRALLLVDNSFVEQ